MNSQDFWRDQKRSEEILREQSAIKGKIERIVAISRAVEDCGALLQLAREEKDESLTGEIQDELLEIEKRISGCEVELLFSGEDDKRNAILTIHPGAGGTESMDWAEMLLRMYTRYSEKNGFSVNVLDLLAGEEAGVKSASLEIKGDKAFGHLKSESGVHRLVRLSPFDANHRRHTSFASVFVYPEIEDSLEVKIRDEDLQIDTFRASGAGGQHVNKTDSAVRITHIPSGIVVQCQNERSQFRNKENALKILRSRLYHLKMEEERKKLSKMLESQKEIAWGNQIRSYVLHPYNMVKDHRTNEQTSDVQAVLDGEIDDFIEAYLRSLASS
jgi:peptide chain release factor 2